MQWLEDVRVGVLVRPIVPELALSVTVVSEAVLVGRGVDGQQAGEGVCGEDLLELVAVVDCKDCGLVEGGPFLVQAVLIVGLVGVSLRSSYWSLLGFLLLVNIVPESFLRGGRRAGVTRGSAELCRNLHALTYGDI